MRQMHPEVCNNCISKNKELPPCVKTHQKATGHRPCLRVMKMSEAGDPCVFYAGWEELVPLLLHHTYDAFDSFSGAMLDNMARDLKRYVGSDNEKYAYSAYARQQCDYVARSPQPLYKGEDLIVHAAHNDSHYPEFLKKFNLHVTPAGRDPQFVFSYWQYDGSCSLSGGKGKFSLSGGFVTLKDPEGNSWEFKYAGGGVSVGIPKIPLPGGGSGSDPNYWSKGYLLKNPLVFGVREFKVHDFIGPCAFGDVSIAAIGGYSGSAIFVGAPMMRALIPMVGIIAGLTAGGSANGGYLSLHKAPR